MNIEITLANINQSPVIAQLYELYTYEMTDLADFDINDNGFYGYDDLPLYWEESKRYPYLIWINKKIGGFVLVQQGSPINDDTRIWDIAEFFVMRKFRGKGIGQFVAHHLWRQHQGEWQIRVWENNNVAHKFWDKTIQNFIKKPIVPNRISYQGHEGLLVYQFQS